MTSENEGAGFLRVELGNFARTTRISPERVSREVAFSNCLVTSWTVMGDVTKLSKDSFREGEILELSVRERMPGDVLWNEEPDGVVDADRMYCDVILPPHVFAPIWSAAGANGSSRRSVELELKARHPEILSVTNVAFFEAMLQYNTALRGEPTQRLNAILVELREMRKELTPLNRLATAAGLTRFSRTTTKKWQLTLRPIYCARGCRLTPLPLFPRRPTHRRGHRP